MHLGQRLIQTTSGALRDLAITVGLGVAIGGLVVLQAYLLSTLIDGAFLGGRGLAALRPWLLGLAAAALVRAICTYAGELHAQRLAARVKLDLRGALARHLAELGPAYTADARTGDLSHRLSGGVEALDAYLAQYLPQVALALLVPGLVLVAVMSADALSALVLLVTFPLVPLFMALIGAQARQASERQLTLLSRLSAQFLEGLQALPLLKAFGRSRQHAARIAEACARFRDASLGVLRVAFLSALVLELLATLSVAIVAVEVGLRLLYGKLGLRVALFVLVLAPEFFRPLRALGSSFHAGAAGVEASRRIFDVLDTPLVPAPAPPRPVAAGPGRIEFADVGFAYEPGHRVLDGVSLTIESGTTLALVGPSGAGKSTLAQLLLRLRQPGVGAIHVDGVPLAEIDPREWRRHLSWVPQRPYLFFGSVRDNLRIARPEATPAELELAVRRAAAHDFITALPRGYDTPLGERGVRLSGGQAQRLALARAFLKDAPILILDEPTAQLDSETEALVQASLRALCRGRTVLLIAHRMTTVIEAARIVVLSAGRVVEQGTHAELLARGRHYADLVAAYGRAT